MRLAGLLLLFLILAITSKAALATGNTSTAGSKSIDKLRKFYREHNLDFFGDLIAGQNDFTEDEKRHAKLELLADDARTKALAQLEALLPRALGGMTAELLLRKATLLSDRARTATYFQNNPFKASKLKTPDVYLRQSIAVFQDIEKRFGTHPKMDVVTFSIAYNFGELKRIDDSFAYYLRLVQKFPESPLVGDARLAIAEIHFDKRRFGDALSQLKEIVRADHPRLKNFALYKMAWTYYNMADLDSAINSLEKVIEGVNSLGVQHARLELRKEALHDLVTYYAERPDNSSAAQASVYFDKIAKTPDAIVKEYEQGREKRLAALKAKNAPIPDDALPESSMSEAEELLFRLVQVYRDQGKHEQSMVVAEQIIGRMEKHPRTVALYRLRAEAAEKLRRRDKVVAELERFAKIIERDLASISDYKNGLPTTEYGDLAATFEKSRAPSLKPATMAKMPDALHADSFYKRELARLGFETFSDFSAFLHGEWTKTQSHDTAHLALAVYDMAVKVSLEPWRGAPLDKAFELRHRRAQLRHAMKLWDLAAQDYEDLRLRIGQPEASVLEYSQGEIASLEQLIKEQKIAAKKGEKFHPVHTRLLAAYDAFLSHFVLSEKLREKASGVLWASAHLNREYGLTVEALTRLDFYSRHFHDQKDAVAATRDVLALLSQGEHWERLRDFSEKLIELGHYKKLDIAKEISRSREYASLRLLETLEKDKDWGKAEKEFAVFAQKNPESPFVSQALLKSANAALQTKDVDAAVKRLEAAAHAPDEAVRLQAWLGLEPYYRKGFQWRKLRALYEAVKKLKAEAKTLAGAKENLAAIHELEEPAFSEKGSTLVEPDPSLRQWIVSEDKFVKQSAEFMKLRFVKSNNNPALNFKKKADMNARLAKLADELAENAPKALKGGAAVWAAIVKSEMLAEFAETMETAALPAALNGATEVDKKSYVETITSQAKELRTQARQLSTEALKLIVQIDFPFALEDRLNKLLERFGEPTRLERLAFSSVWATRPGAVRKKRASLDESDITSLGMKILRSEKQDETRELELKLARLYFESGELGYAYAVLAAMGGKDDLGAQAARMQYEIDALRLPKDLRAATEAGVLSPQVRWDLARWIAGRGAMARDLSSDRGFSKEELQWFEDATKTLLRPEVTASPAIQATAASSR